MCESLLYIKFIPFMVAEDVPRYGALCTLASLQRDEVYERLLNSPFQQFLDFVPALKDMVREYCSSKTSCVQKLDSVIDLYWDIYLSGHTDLKHRIIKRMHNKIQGA